MKGNYYYFAPMVDEKGNIVETCCGNDQWIEQEGIPQRKTFVSSAKYPILTIKKFDNLKDLKEFINGLV